MAATTARTKKDVDEMSSSDRLWDSLDYSYGKKGEKIGAEYDKLASQQDRQMQSRGLGRSTMAMQAAANVGKQKIDALDDNYSQQIADYENRLGDEEDKAWQRDFSERQFAENTRQFNTNLAYQKEENAAQRAWQSGESAAQRGWQGEQNAADRAMNQGQFDATMAYNRERATAADNQWAQEFAANRADTAWNQNYQQQQADRSQANWQAEFNANRSDTAWNQRYQQQQADRSQANWEAEFGETRRLNDRNFNYQLSRDAVSDARYAQEYADSRADTAWQKSFQERQYADSRSDTAWQQAFTERQWEAQQAQWREEFDYQKMTNDQKIAFSVIEEALANGKDVPDSILERAGISRADYNSMKADAVATSGYSYTPGATDGTDTPGDEAGGETPPENVFGFDTGEETPPKGTDQTGDPNPQWKNKWYEKYDTFDEVRNAYLKKNTDTTNNTTSTGTDKSSSDNSKKEKKIVGTAKDNWYQNTKTQDRVRKYLGQGKSVTGTK